MPIRTPLIVIVLLLAALLAGSLIGGPGGARSGPPRALDVTAEVHRIAARVESLRGLKFRRLPPVRVVTPATARREGLADLRRTTAAARQAADTELLELLGLLPAGTNQERIAADVYGEQVAGYYDPRTKRLAVVAGPGAGPTSGPLAEITLAHELTHALEDQRFGLHDPGGSTDDRASAGLALVEGTATEVMTLYAERYVGAGDLLSSAFEGLAQTSQATPLPPYVENSLLFPYESGQKFVAALRRLGHGWALVDLALRSRRPASTEQIIHPLDWARGKAPLPVALPRAGQLGGGWRQIASGGLGELLTHQILRLANRPLVAGDAAAGWGGGRYALFRRGPLPARGCAGPCASQDALVLRWRWDSARDGSEFAAAARRYMALRRKAVPAAVLRIGPRAATIVFAPTGALARTLAAAG